MPTKTRPPYPPEFRQQMVELVRAGRHPEDLAREFEPSAQAIRNWVAQAERDEGRRSDGLTSPEREELRQTYLGGLANLAGPIPPVGTNPTSGNTAAIARTVAGPPAAWAGKNFTTSTPRPRAAGTSEGVITPGTTGTRRSRHQETTEASSAGDVARRAEPSQQGAVRQLTRQAE